MAATQAGQQTVIDACAKMANAATHACAAAPAAPPPAPDPPWEAIATGLAMQANAISVAAAVLGALALVSAVGWAVFVRRAAKEEARAAAEEEVRSLAPEIIDAWMATHGIAIIRQVTQMSLPSEPPEEEVADEIAAAAGDEAQ